MRRVLYIDDDAGLRRLVERVLTRRGWTVATAGGGEEGLVLARAERFDLIAVDHFMPGMDGLATLEALHALPERPGVVPGVVYVTGSEDASIAIAALRAGADDYVVKAVGDDFFDLLDAALLRVRARGQLAAQKAAVEADLRATNARLEALLAEVNHRVANSLQIVSAMVRMQSTALADTGADGAARAALEDTQRRIAAIAQVHRRLYTQGDVETVDMQEYLSALVEELGATWSTEALPRALSLAADPIRLPTDRAVSLGVIVTELVSNACKYAYPEGSGEVRVALVRDGEERFVLAVEDDGVGLSGEISPKGTGVGTKLIRAMAMSLQSAVEYDAAHRGTRATLSAAVR